MAAYEYTVLPEESGCRIDRYLSEKPELPSRSYLQKLIEEESITVGKRAVKGNYKVRTGDEIQVVIPEPK